MLKKILTNTAIALVACFSIALIFNQPIANVMQKNTTKTYAIEHVTKDEIKVNEEKEVTFDFNQVEAIDLSKIITSKTDTQDLPVIGAIAIPSVKIHLPIFKGLSNVNLLYGAGTAMPDQQMGKNNYGLVSHRSTQKDYLFTPLDKVQKGALIYLTDKETIYTYKIDTKEEVTPDKVQYLKPDERQGEDVITLITCSNDEGTKRWAVQGVLIGQVSVQDASQGMADAFNIEKKALYS